MFKKGMKTVGKKMDKEDIADMKKGKYSAKEEKREMASKKKKPAKKK